MKKIRFNLLAGIILLISFVLTLVLRYLVKSTTAVLIYSFVFPLVALGIPFTVYYFINHKSGASLKKLINFKKISYKQILISIVLAIVFYFACFYLSSGVVGIYQKITNSLFMKTTEVHYSVGIFICLIIASAIRATMIETIYRGAGIYAYKGVKHLEFLIPLLLSLMTTFNIYTAAKYLVIGIVAMLLSKKYGVLTSIVFAIVFEIMSLISSNYFSLPYDCFYLTSIESAALYGMRALAIGIIMLAICGIIVIRGICFQKVNRVSVCSQKLNKDECITLTGVISVYAIIMILNIVVLI